jgi:hypothetical protein
MTGLSLPSLVRLVVTALVLCSPGPARAQGVQTGTIAGTVRDPAGLVLPGATVSASSPALQGERVSVTDENGQYVIRALPPGRYAVRVELSGFGASQYEATVDLGLATQVDARLELGGVQEQVTVVGAAASVITNTEGGANYKKPEIDALPTPRTLSGIAELAPGLTDNTPNARQVTIHGAFAYDNVFLVDGVDVNDNLFGNPNNLFIEDAIEETQVLTSGISAEYGRFSGGVINAITKRGGDIFSGSFRSNLTNPSWTDETPFEVDAETIRPDELSTSYEGTFGGPVLRSRLWFFTAGRFQDRTDSVALDETGIQVSEKDRNTRFEGKLTGTMLRNHTVQGSYLDNRSDLTQRTFAFDIDPVSSASPEIRNHLFVTNYKGVYGSRLLVEAQFSRKFYEVTGQGGTERDIRRSPFISPDPLGLYNAPYFDATDPEQRNNRQMTGSVSYFVSTPRAGSHDLKGGVEWYESSNTGGNSQSSTDFVFFAPYAMDAGGRPVILPDGRFVPLFAPGAVFVNNWRATRGGQLDVRTTSFYVHDRWTANAHWTFDAGLRYERVRSEATGGIVGIDTDTLVPRLGASFDPSGTGQWQIQATYSHYAGKYSEAYVANNTTVGNPDRITYLYLGPSGQGFDFAPGFDFDNYLIVDGEFNTVNVLFEDGLSSPLTREFTASVGKRFGPRAYGKATWVQRRVSDIVEDYIDLTTGSTSVTQDGAEFGPFNNAIYRNSDEPVRDYRALVFQGNYRVTDRWSLNGHYTLQIENDGNFDGEATNQPALSSVIGDYPELHSEARHYPSGRLFTFQRHKARLWTIYNIGLGRAGGVDASLMWRFNSALTYSLRSDGEGLSAVQQQLAAGYVSMPAEQTIYFGRRGSESFKGFHVLDAAFTYAIPVFRSVRPWLKVEVRNLLNDQTLIGWDTTVSPDPATTLDALGLPTGYVRGVRFGQASAITDYPTPRTFLMAMGFRF